VTEEGEGRRMNVHGRRRTYTGFARRKKSMSHGKEAADQKGPPRRREHNEQNSNKMDHHQVPMMTTYNGTRMGRTSSTEKKQDNLINFLHKMSAPTERCPCG